MTVYRTNSAIQDNIMFELVLFVVVAAAASASALVPHASIGNINNRIINSENATIESFPFQVSFLEKNFVQCGGSIISNEWVITAASCVFDKTIAKLSIRAGSNTFEKGGSIHQIDNIILHPNYFWGNHRYRCDIALVHVTNPFNFDGTRAPISMFNLNEESVPGTTAIISGWGGNEIFVDVYLQTKELDIISKNECAELYPSGVYDIKNQLCVGHPVACRSDSGGPLTINGRLAGIISSHTSCRKSKPNTPSMHIEVSPFRPWIESVTGI